MVEISKPVLAQTSWYNLREAEGPTKIISAFFMVSWKMKSIADSLIKDKWKIIFVRQFLDAWISIYCGDFLSRRDSLNHLKLPSSSINCSDCREKLANTIYVREES